MNETMGRRIAAYRREKMMKQDELAEKLGVSAQAVSKRENDLTCPDITLLPALAKNFDVTVDELLSGKQAVETNVQVLPEEKRKDIKDTMLRIIISTDDDENIRISIPMVLVQVAVETGMGMPQISNNKALQSVDFAQILALVNKGAIGNLMEMEADDNTTIRIFVE